MPQPDTRPAQKPRTRHLPYGRRAVKQTEPVAAAARDYKRVVRRYDLAIATSLTICLCLAAVNESGAQDALASQICEPPQEPWVPQGDDDLREYADLIAGDFERYFRDLTSYFSCVDASRQAVFERSRSVSAAHEAFWQRAKALGVERKAATTHGDIEAVP